MNNSTENNWFAMIGIAFTGYVALFPAAFSAMGNNLKWLILTYSSWTNISTVIIITLLVVIIRLLIQQKNDPSPR